MSVYIPDIIGDVVKATQDKVLSQIQAAETLALGSSMIQQIRYSKSSFDELIETLAQADGSKDERFNKYPLIHLVRDFPEDRGQDAGVYATATLGIVFIHQTVNTYKIDDRDEKVFKPVLIPIYEEFLRQLWKSSWTFGNDKGQYKHRKINRAFWGNRNLQGAKNMLNDYVDAIEVINLQLKFNFSNC
ncbi:MAG: hypothetical protein NVSMB46_09590 [Candidatus Saccharimonadales bacterium]